MENFHAYESAARKKFENIGSVTVDGAYRFFEGLRNLSPSKEDMSAASKRSGARPFKDDAPMSGTRGELRLKTGDVIAIAIELDKITQERLTAAAARHDAQRMLRYEAEERRAQREAQLRSAEANRAAALDNMISAHLVKGAKR